MSTMSKNQVLKRLREVKRLFGQFNEEALYAKGFPAFLVKGHKEYLLKQIEELEKQTSNHNTPTEKKVKRRFFRKKQKKVDLK